MSALGATGTARLFQFTPLREGRPNAHTLKIAFEKISIHAPPRGATPCGRRSKRANLYFNSRPSARGDGYTDVEVGLHLNFNSRPSARGDARNQGDFRRERISIHAPPRGATICGDAFFSGLRISIHAPPRGATKWRDSNAAGDDFNSRPSARGDAKSYPVSKLFRAFQFTPLREGRPTMSFISCVFISFQFTPLREGRPCPKSQYPTFWAFQFTPLREGRLGVPLLCMTQFISIHAPPRGATGSSVNDGWTIKLFQFTPLREGRHKHCLFQLLIDFHFNSRPSVRGDFHVSLHRLPTRHFNSRPSARGDLHRQQEAVWSLFQFTPLREGRRAWMGEEALEDLISIHAPPRGATR